MKPSGLLDRQVGRLRALEDFVHENGGAAEQIGKVLTIAHQSASLHVFALRKHRRQPPCECQLSDVLPLRKENSVRRSDDPPYPLLVKSRECALDLLLIACCDWRDGKAGSLAGDLCILEDRSKIGIFRIAEDSYARCAGRDHCQQLQLFWSCVVGGSGEASDVAAGMG